MSDGLLADHLTRQGIVVLRLDDRGVGQSGGQLHQATLGLLAQDALAAVELLRDQNYVDPKRVGLVGHSEGGTVAALSASLDNKLGFIVMLAGPAVSMTDTLAEQNRALLNAASRPELVDAKLDWLNKLEKLTQLKNADERRRKIVAHIQADPAAGGSIDATLATTIAEAQLDTALFRSYFAHDLSVFGRDIRCSVLALFGKLDMQVSADQNAPTLKKALRRRKNRDVTIEVVDGANHLFQPATTGHPSEYQTIETTILPEVLERVSEWILKQK